MDVKMYEAQDDTISVDDIATNSNNRNVLRRIKRNKVDDSNELFIQNHYDRVGDYRPEGAYDMRWLGYFVGKNDYLKNLYMRPFEPNTGSSVRDAIEPFFRGISSNKSIQTIKFFGGIDLLGGELFTMLTPFFQNNYNLTNITIYDCDFGDEGGRLFALAIGSCTNKSLKKLDLRENTISEEGMVDILTALSVHPNLNYIDLVGNRLSKNGCVALATSLQFSAKELQYLFISYTEINDEGIEALVPALATCCHLKELFISNNQSITARGWNSLAAILESPSCNLRELYISGNNINDEVVAAFANVLKKNRTLHTLDLWSNSSITNIGWEAFSKVICDTSSVNATFLSNHTLYDLGHEGNGNEIIGPLLELNESDDKKEVAAIKILQSHDDFDMLPFFEWEFKVLPIVLGWLERASEYEMPEDFEPNVEERKLSTIYQFVRGMPLLYVETRLREELEDINAEESKPEEEQQKLDQGFEHRKQYLQKRKDSIMKKLGGASYNIKHR